MNGQVSDWMNESIISRISGDCTPSASWPNGRTVTADPRQETWALSPEPWSFCGGGQKVSLIIVRQARSRSSLGEFSPTSGKWGSSLTYGCNYALLLTTTSREARGCLWPFCLTCELWPQSKGAAGAFSKDPVDGDNKHEAQLPRRLITGEQSASFLPSFFKPCPLVLGIISMVKIQAIGDSTDCFILLCSIGLDPSHLQSAVLP